MKKTLFFVTMTVLICLCFSACADRKGADSLWETAVYTEDTELGEGAKTIEFEVEAENRKVTFTIHTDKSNLGEALMEHHLASGEKGPYGLYVKAINGMTADYTKNKTYWEFFKGEEGLTTGVDGEEINHGDKYMAKHNTSQQ